MQIAIDQNYARQYVVIAKQSLAGKPNDLKAVEDSYRQLSSTYNGWLKVVKLAVASGDKKFEKSGDNKKAATQAAQQTQAFVDLVKKKTEPAATSSGQKIGFS
ncbi:MAG: hypothetical protein M3348_06550, partial [Acidobacteriota bacterium]|nr:hypothetical protein [Acidobacteriota bacterium]